MKTKGLLLIWLVVSAWLVWYSLFNVDQTTVHNLKISTTMTYSGPMRDQYFEGQGTLALKDGSKYEGNFKRGRFDGQGRFDSAAGWHYQGNFSNGRASGQGTLTLANHKVFRGTFKDGSFQK